VIKLDKAKEPDVLKDNTVKWTTELMGYVDKGEKVPKSLENKYNQGNIKVILQEETFYKCMYCESKVEHVAHEHIEHIKPKAVNKFPKLTFSWENLGIACPKCNMNKSDLYDEEHPFINPYQDQPSNHFYAFGPYIFHKPGDKRGEITEVTIKINRAELIEQRVERIRLLRVLADKFANEKNKILKSSILKEIKIELGKDKVYSMCTNSIIKVENDSLVVG
jgi:5-methylcytosine-specific restriction endonuclease McrA